MQRKCRWAMTASIVLFAATAMSYGSQIEGAGTSLAQRVAASGKKSLAVVDFTDLDGRVTWLGRFLAEELSVSLLSEPSGVTVIERTQLRVLMKEHKLAESGILDPQTVRRLGQIATIDVIIAGSITPLGDTVRVTLKAMDASTAKLVAAQTVEIPRTKAIEELLARGLAGEAPDSSREGSMSNDSVAPGATLKALPVVIQNGFQFELTGCARFVGGVRCGLRVRNLEAEDRDLVIQGSSRAVDETGTEWENASRTLARSEARGRIGNSVMSRMVSGVPITGSFSFTGGAQGARNFVLLEFDCTYYRIQFRNIAIN